MAKTTHDLLSCPKNTAFDLLVSLSFPSSAVSLPVKLSFFWAWALAPECVELRSPGLGDENRGRLRLEFHGGWETVFPMLAQNPGGISWSVVVGGIYLVPILFVWEAWFPNCLLIV